MALPFPTSIGGREGLSRSPGTAAVLLTGYGKLSSCMCGESRTSADVWISGSRWALQRASKCPS